MQGDPKNFVLFAKESQAISIKENYTNAMQHTRPHCLCITEAAGNVSRCVGFSASHSLRSSPPLYTYTCTIQ